MIINLDFDGTVVAHDFPRIGKDIGAVPVLKKLVANGHKLILFTMRSDQGLVPIIGTTEWASANFLQDAVNWFKNNDIPLYGIQFNPTQASWTSSPKSYAELMIDDSALFAPLILDKSISNRPFLDWIEVEKELIKRGLC